MWQWKNTSLRCIKITALAVQLFRHIDARDLLALRSFRKKSDLTTTPQSLSTYLWVVIAIQFELIVVTMLPLLVWLYQEKALCLFGCCTCLLTVHVWWHYYIVYKCFNCPYKNVIHCFYRFGGEVERDSRQCGQWNSWFEGLFPSLHNRNHKGCVWQLHENAILPAFLQAMQVFFFCHQNMFHTTLLQRFRCNFSSISAWVIYCDIDVHLFPDPIIL